MGVARVELPQSFSKLNLIFKYQNVFSFEKKTSRKKMPQIADFNYLKGFGVEDNGFHFLYDSGE